MSACLGVGLAACCGFRVFVPLFVAAVGHKLGFVGSLSAFEWLDSWAALVTLGVATFVELGAYYIPWLDNALDALAAPAAIIAGTILTTSFLKLDSPVFNWGLGLILGGGSAGLIQAGTSLLRLGSTATTGGLANPVVATTENAAAIGLSVLAVLLPLFAFVVVILVLLFMLTRLMSKRVVWFTKGKMAFRKPADFSNPLTRNRNGQGLK